MTTHNSKVAPSPGKWRGRVIKKTRQSRSISLVPLIVKVPPGRLKGIKLTKPRKSPKKSKLHREAAHSRPLQTGVGRDVIVDEPVSNSAETKIVGSCDNTETSYENPTLNKDAVRSSTLPGVVRRRRPPKTKSGIRPKGDGLKSMQDREKMGIEETDAALFATQSSSSSNSLFATQSSSSSNSLFATQSSSSSNSLFAAAEDLITDSSHLTTGDESTELDYSSLDAEYPLPSTPQQKMIRRLAREKQLEDMRVREAALAREERYQRRQGVVKPSRTQSSKHIKWKSESDLVEMFIYSPHKESLDVVPS